MSTIVHVDPTWYDYFDMLGFNVDRSSGNYYPYETRFTKEEVLAGTAKQLGSTTVGAAFRNIGSPSASNCDRYIEFSVSDTSRAMYTVITAVIGIRKTTTIE